MKIHPSALVVLLVASLPVLANADEGDSMAAAAPLNVRTGPGLDHAILDTLAIGERVLVNHCIDEWCEITRVGIDGWVYAPYLVAAGFSETWHAGSYDLPATLGSDTIGDFDLDVLIDVTSPRSGPARPKP